MSSGNASRQTGFDPKTMPSAVIVSLSLFNALNSVLGTLVNFAVCVVIYQNEELQNGLDLLIGNLCLADLAVCALAEPMYIGFLHSKLNDQSSKAFETISVITLHAVAINLVVIAINRMNAIANPFKNTFIFSKAKVLMLISCVWIGAILMAVFLLETQEGKAFSPYSHLLLILTFLLAYVRIFWIANKQQRKIDIQREAISHNFQQVRLQRANRAARTTALIVLSFMICFFPDTVYDFIEDVDVMIERKKWLFSLLYFSCLLNPCIYMFRTDSFKAALKRTLGISN
ncbi:predicted protein [Nematostella vectensis]|uniref:G-protein coupled receptors family 1 profile domain-containing protein n=1 Tax=Nematostella vectensis TaxID=45351 RepID=A7SBN8_NEMVE|nr:predicted protein [Nematostella vectensis]|eukprot:XP_001630938.1 predicted protein [Nematostella vectensis]